MSDRIICGTCGKHYDPSEILAVIGDEAVATLAELRPAPAKEHDGSSARVLGRIFTGAPRKQPEAKEFDPQVFDDLRAYSFECPRGHPVDGNPGTPLGLGVLGGSGASKSHWLAAIVREMDALGALRKAGVRV